MRIKTASASLYIGKLCRHFVHKIEATYTKDTGKAIFPAGSCDMHAEPEYLVFNIESADEEGLNKMKGALDRHLIKFAYKEDLEINWVDEVA